MERKEFNKLIRDRIPEKIAADGAQATLHILGQADFVAALKNKVVEEAYELAQAKGADLINEIADVQEVIAALIAAEGISESSVAEARTKKLEKNGGFNARLFLQYTEK